MFTSCIFFLFLLITETICIPSNSLNKRQAIASRACGDQTNTVSICSPTSTSIWYNNTDQAITWKWNNPTFDQYTNLDLYLLYQNATDAGTINYQTIKTWLNLEKSKGILVPHLDDSWYPSRLPDNSPNVSLTMFLYIVGAGYDIQSDLDLIPTAHNFFPVPQSFTLIENSINTTASPSSTISNSSPTNTSPVTGSSGSNSKSLPGWAIAVIVIAALLCILATCALIWAYRKYKNKKQLNGGVQDEKTPVLTPIKNESNIAVASTGATALAGGTAAAAATTDNHSIHSSTQQLWPPRSPQDEISFSSEKPTQHQLGLNQEANMSSSILSSTDALMIADTFRQFMRKPDWNEELEMNEKNRIIQKNDDSKQ